MPDEEYELEAVSTGNDFNWLMERFPIIHTWCQWAEAHLILVEDWQQRLERLIWNKSEQQVTDSFTRQLCRFPPLVVPSPLLFGTILGQRRLITSDRISRITDMARVECTDFTVYAIFVVPLGAEQVKLIVMNHDQDIVVSRTGEFSDPQMTQYLDEWLKAEVKAPQDFVVYHPKIIVAWRMPEAEDTAVEKGSAMQQKDIGHREESSARAEREQDDSASASAQ
jgi:hypothetical protein